MPPLQKFPDYFRSYRWSDKHSLYGYPPDSYGDFDWIASLERRFQWLRKNHASSVTSSLCLIREMIQWGGSQNGVLQKFDERLGETNLRELLTDVITNIGDQKQAIEAALRLPGMGLTYASKLLRFLDPDNYGALDSRVRAALQGKVAPSAIGKIHDGNQNSMSKGYLEFLKYVSAIGQQLDSEGIARPPCNLPTGARRGWRTADIEMALFKWAES